ncbi:type III-A CRISPR-associated protein Cas10/Csm1 [Zhenpiania hominis]|uniref:CRISPR system single-strand-specific deoxyribonuclease Cas10/Csm1 (subtype III-A) n=1 Tax=Zhenpiania hominis TaxID=2763644 RepID=A0A923SRV5_9FIRM|nr:type III-A CRISPR-associated protein Cas10/Csm1 [Zhenpiania hominis]MBC6679709.1 type III-A CRISPR-associated protein Cas10/Csm1 [Zhenpiania hominis]
MDKRKLEIVVGGLFHDIGKPLYRYLDQRNHSLSGYDWLKEIGIEDEEILRQVRYHHAAYLKKAEIPDDSLAYITYWADNVAAGVDRREEALSENSTPYARDLPLSSIFNILNGNHQNYVYSTVLPSDEREIIYPEEKINALEESDYGKIIENIRNVLKGMEWKDEYINSLLEVMEANLSYIPSSTSTTQIADVSLYDHVKITAAVGSCILDYTKEKQITDFRKALFKEGKVFYDEEAFLLCSMDISGIQNFIYTITASRALKNLRARSFYLEIMMEHIVDQLLSKLELSRANLIYTGGGHAYLLLPNTKTCRANVNEFEKHLNEWLRDNFDTALYMAIGYVPCSANQLMNEPKGEGTYRGIFHKVSSILSEKKAHRYNGDDIRILNGQTQGEHERECKVCGRSDRLVNDDRCEICYGLETLANDIMEKDFVVILSQKPEISAVILPGGCYMIMEDEKQLTNRMKNDPYYVRTYGKNRMFTGVHIATKLWTGDYKSAKEFSELAGAATGARRLGVLRADVDNLGQAFVAGFDEDHVSLSRTAAFSRKLSVFFKLYINTVLRNPQFVLGDKQSEYRNALIVYSGGDDVFVVGSWDDMIGFAIDLNDSLKRFSQGTLKISAGIGMFHEKYPISAMAYETGRLEECSKSKDEKNSITLFYPEEQRMGESSTYGWDELKEQVIGEKLTLLQNYFKKIPEKGNSMLYKMLGFIRNKDKDRINLARYAYLLARIEPEKDDTPERKELYQEFSQKMYKWIQNEEDTKQLITAIYLFVYLNRKKEEK